MDDRFQAKRYVVTGASSGIGEEISRALHRRGARVVLVARREERLRSLAEDLNARRASSAEVLSIDLSDRTREEGGLAQLERYLEGESVDGLVNNAGFGSFGKFEELPRECEEEMMQVNVVAPLRLSHAVLPQMLARGHGNIIHVASIAAFQPLPYMASYAATKAALLSLSLAQHAEYLDKGIRVVAVCPGPVATEFAEVARVPGGFEDLPGESVSSVAEAALSALHRKVPVVVPGLSGKLLAFGSHITPRWLQLRILRRMLGEKMRG
ncbi:SDR family oxidoreductase [bacterium]|nr:SDR family oxidoreductase [bacterium]